MTSLRTVPLSVFAAAVPTIVHTSSLLIRPNAVPRSIDAPGW